MNIKENLTMSTRNYFVIIIVVIAVLLIIVDSIFLNGTKEIYQLPNISSKGEFVNKLCTIVTAIAALLNVLAFIILTIYVARLQKDISSVSIKEQKNLTVAKLKIDIVNELRSSINNIDNYNANSYSKIGLYLTSFRKTYVIVFFNTDDIKAKYDNLINITSDISNSNSFNSNDIYSFMKEKDEVIILLLQKIKKELE